MTASTLQVGNVEVSYEDACAVVLGYCLGTRTSKRSHPRGRVGDRFPSLTLGDYAYRTYDCVSPSDSHELTALDVLVADGLNAKMMAGDIAGALAVGREVGVQIERVRRDNRAFWEIEGVAKRPERDDHPAWPLWRAWTILSSVHGMNVARVHKILHHKSPTVFPLIDNMTVGALGGRGKAWATIRKELDLAPEAWSALENDINETLIANGGSPIYRLRLHDILLWTRMTPSSDRGANFELAKRKGAELDGK